MKKTKSFFAVALLAAAVFAPLLPGCASVKPADERVRWTAKTDKKTGECLVSMTPRARTVIAGRADKDATGNLVVSVERLRWFNNWHDGWTEADIPAEGTIVVTADSSSKTGLEVSSIEPIALSDAEDARIRYRDTILSGDQAAALFNRRLGRVEAASAWLAETIPEAATYRQFAASSSRLLFPEAYGYPEGVKRSAKIKENRTAGEGYLWDTDYTASAIPEVLREVRNSGTLFRDWEESSELFYFMYVQEKLK